MTRHLLKISLPLLLLVVMVQLDSCGGGDTNSQTQANVSNNQNDTKPSDKSTVPVFNAKDLDGNWHTSTEWVGKKPVVINFWGTWCPPCRREIPDLVKLNKEYSAKGVELISLAVKDTPGKVKDYADENGMDWEMLMAVDQILIDYKAIQGVPTTIFINKDGVEVGRFVGMRDYQTLKSGFDSII